MAKLNISMPQELLDLIDAEADALGVSRSGLIQEASARYVVQSREDRETEIARLKARDAVRRMKRIGERIGLSAEDAVELLEQSRHAEESRHGG